MNLEPSLSKRLRGAWAGRVSGCLLGKPLEVLSFRQGRNGILNYLEAAGALPLRDYVPALEGSLVDLTLRPVAHAARPAQGPTQGLGSRALEETGHRGPGRPEHR